ncbi:cytochrome P450 86B1-like [Lolium rigidum]|uniref:cytochrome P450 86B1-like n=1 Tax=Lolium rigidum TaxID=89674 RepID=UPI001F5C598E|nr:cytochrome P450 86B1-like [Lolium rigidum]
MAGRTSFLEAALHAMHEHVRFSDLAVAAALLFACSSAMARLTSRRGPMLWPVFGIIPTLFANLGDIYDWGATLLVRTGGTFPYRGMWGGGSSGVMTSVPANVEHVLKNNFDNYPKGAYYRERFAELLGDGIFNADGEAWRAQRRAATVEMHSAQFLDFSATTIGQLVHGRLMPLLHRLQQQGAVVDLQEVLLRFTFDNICAAAFGVEAGCLADGLPDVPFARAFERATELSLSRFVTPPFIWKAKRLLRVGGERRLTEAARSVREFADRTVSERRTELRKIGSLHGRCDLLSRLMSSSSSGATDHSDEFLRDFCISFILAGRDTSSVALVWFFWLLAGHPDVEARVLEDVRAAHGDVKKMEYLHAALTEAMRLYPPVPIDFKEAVEDDVLPDGTAILARQRVIYNAYAIGRDPAVWGHGCQEFRPERWMKGGVFAGGAESPFKYVVFNAGPRLCVGKRFAYTQMKTLVAAVLQAFAVEVAPGQTVKPKLNTTLYMKNGLMVSFRIREASSTTATVAAQE